MIGDKLSDYTSLFLGFIFLTVVFIGTVIHMRLKARAKARRDQLPNGPFSKPAPDRPELLGHR